MNESHHSNSRGAGGQHLKGDATSHKGRGHLMTRIRIQNYRCFVAPAEVEFHSGLTAFLGVNNAGKSALIRFLVEFRSLFQIMRDDRAQMDAALRAAARPIEIQHVLDPEEAFNNLNSRPIDISIEFNNPDGISDSAIDGVNITVQRNRQWSMKIFQNGQRIGQLGVTEWRPDGYTVFQGGATLNLRPLFEIINIFSNTLYIGPFRNIINVGANTTYFDIQIGDAFVAQFRELKTGTSKRNSIGIQRLIEDIRRIFEFSSLAIDPSHDNRSLHIVVNGIPFKQHELGSGLSQFIVVLANAAIKAPDLILIDEPELNLHPRLQLDFLTALCSYSANGAWFSTHSVGLARSAADSIYAVRRIGDGNSAVHLLEGHPRLSELLGELNYSTQRDLGAEKVLLVEGPTEVKVVQQLLRRRRKDHQILLLSMHGHLPQLEELDEILRITPHVSALIDSEKATQQNWRRSAKRLSNFSDRRD